MMANSPSAIYATNVRHYQHVLQGLTQRWDSVGFLGPSEFSPTALQRLKKIIPARVASILARREGPALPDDVVRLGMLHVANLPSVLSRLTGRSATPAEIRTIHRFQAGQVARAGRGAAFLQTVEGLGYMAIRENAAQLTVVERRNLHHAVFEETLDTHLDFPFRTKLDPLRDILEEEYQGADRIVVYSEVAKASFVERGYSADRIWVSPLPVVASPPLGGHNSRRDPFQLLYVGRLDAYKGIDVAVAAVQSLGSPFKLVVAGPGGEAERAWLEQQDQVEYRGVLPRHELADLFRSSAALLAPSIESFGLAVLEATVAGTPVLVRETTGVVDYLPPGSFRVVPSRDSERWAHAIAQGFESLGGAWAAENAKILAFASAVSNQTSLIDELISSDEEGEK